MGTMAMAAVSTSWVAPISSSRRTLASAARRFLVFPRSLPITKRYSLATTSPLLPAGICDVAHALKQGSGAGGDTLLKGVDRTVIEVVKNVTEMARRASSRREIVQTDFRTPPMLKESMLALEKLADIKAVAQGGYPQAERCRISVGHPEAMTGAPDEVAALSISGNFGFEPCSHGDFLGAILGTGIVREKVGDILLQSNQFLSREKRELRSLLFQNLLIFWYQPWIRLVKFQSHAHKYHCLLWSMNHQGPNHSKPLKHH